MAIEELVDSYGTSYDALRLSTGDTVGQLWLELGGPDDSRALAFAETAEDLVNAAAQETAELVDNYVAEYVSTVRGQPTGPSGLDLAEFVIDQLRGVPGLDVYRRPALETRRLLAEGKPYEAAMQQAGRRAAAMAEADIGLAHRRAGVSSMSSTPGVDGYRRTLTGKSCTLCMIASTQRYRTGELMPIHTRCDCRVAPLVAGTDYGRVINRELYRELKASGAIDSISKARKAAAASPAAQRGKATAARQSATDRRERLRLELAAETNVGRQGRLETRVDRANADIIAADRELTRLGPGPVRPRRPVTGPRSRRTSDVELEEGIVAGFARRTAPPPAPAVRQHSELGPVLVNERHAYTRVTPSTAGTHRLDVDADRLRATDAPPPSKITTQRPDVPDAPATPTTALTPPKAPRAPRYTIDSPEVMRAANRRNVAPAKVVEELNSKAARRAQEAASVRADARALTVDSPDVIRVADKYGVSADEVLVARSRVKEVRRVIADEAARVQADAFGDLDQWDALKVTRPPKVGVRSASGSTLKRGEYDWLEQIDDRERARLSRVWFTDGAAYAPDQLAEQLSARLGREIDVDEAIEIWLDRNRRIEAAGALRRGKLPADRSYSGQIDPDALLPQIQADGYSVTRILGDELDAAGHIASVERTVVRREAEDYLGAALDPQLGPAPFRMSFQSWQDDVSELEYAVRNGSPATLRVGDDVVELSADQAADRLAELVPYYLDEPGTSFEELYARIISTAHKAEQEVPDYARIPWQ